MNVFNKELFNGHHAVISGGSGAIGVGIVKKLVEHGASVTVNDIMDPAEGQARLSDEGIDLDKILYVQGDLTQISECNTLVEKARTHFGPIHTALCHTGMVIAKPILDYSPEEWDQTMATNLKTAYLLAKVSAEAMIEDKVTGHLVFTSSWVADVPWPEIGPYNTSKSGMNMLMRSCAYELAGNGIRANAVAPGFVSVGLSKILWDTDMVYRERAKKAIPLGHMAPLDTLADTYLFLCSPAAAYMTGSVLLVDGGANLYPNI